MPLKKLTALILAIILAAPMWGGDNTNRKRHKKIVAPIIVLPDELPSKALQSKTMSVPKEARLHNLASWAGLASEGIDVSHYQGEIDWNRVAETKLISYVYIKASEGESLTDEYYRVNIEGARNAGLKVGSYHYYRPDANAEMQLNNLTSQIRKEEQDLAPIIDIEKRGSKSDEDFIADFRTFLKNVEAHYGCKPVIYTFHNFYNKYLSGQFKDYRFIIARYREDEPVLDDGKSYEGWQYTSHGRIDGIRGYVDRSMVMPDFSVADFAINE